MEARSQLRHRPTSKKRLEPNDLPGKAGARSQLRHRPTIEDKKPKPDEVGIEGTTEFIFAHIAGIVNASSILLFVSTGLFWHN
jgi:hypothetical protein